MRRMDWTPVSESNLLRLKAGPRLALRISNSETVQADYPTDCIHKGLVLECEGEALSEEGVGFGLPVIKRGREAVFPGGARVTFLGSSQAGLSVEYLMNLHERLALGGGSFLKGRLASSLKNAAALLHRSYPLARGAFTAVSNSMRAAFGIRTVFERGRSAGTIRVEYRLDPARGELGITMDASGVQDNGVTELVLMNEQGARHFTEYADSDGARLRSADIGTWYPVPAEEASFRDPRHGVRFSVRKVPGARLYRGRELVRGRLSWAGFAYLLPPTTVAFGCSVVIERQLAG